MKIVLNDAETKVVDSAKEIVKPVVNTGKKVINIIGNFLVKISK